MKLPTVSVIMGIYNCEETLATSINSIINQTFKDWELILCDDDSSDSTLEIAKKFQTKYSNISLIKNERNMGLAYSLNRCLKVAKGKYIARMDGDDICFPERFQKQVIFLNETPEYKVVGSAAVLYVNNKLKSIRNMREIPSKFDLARDVPFIHPTIMMHKEIYDILEGYTVSKITRRGQDADLWFRFYAAGYKGYNLQIPLIKYHESIEDYKKRNLKVRLMGIKRRFIGFKRLKLPLIYYIYIFKPLLTGLVPNSIMYLYHQRKKGYLYE